MLNASLSRSAAALPTLVLLFAAVGCSQMGGAPAGGPQSAAVTLSPEQQQAIAMQTQQYQQRATALDRDNQELQSMLAQSKQQVQLLQEQVTATQTQLRDTTSQLAALQTDNQQMMSAGTSAMAASIRTQSQAEIRSNNSLLRNLTITNLPGVQVRQDGDVIRVEIPSDQLFNPNTAQIKYGADATLRSIGADLVRNYPQQMIGIEGHTDNSLSATSQAGNAQHLSVAQATAVYDALVRAAGMPANQLFVVGHGPNHPVVSNGSEAGQARNRRIELVIYPETVAR